MNASSPTHFELDLDRVRFQGSDLSRPECVIATRRGVLYVPDWRGGIVRLDPDGRRTAIGCASNNDNTDFLPNGIALLRDGSFLVANLGQAGGIWRMHADGRRVPWLTEVDGTPLPAVNFVWLDSQERVWFTVMFRSHPGAGRHGFDGHTPDAWIGIVDNVESPSSARQAGDGLVTANECRIGLDGRHLYVNETFAHRLTRFALKTDGSLGAPAVVAQFDDDTLPDGLTLDAEGAFWITAVAANRLLRVWPDGRTQVVAEDADPQHMARVRAAVRDGTLDRTLLYDNHARVLPNITSLAFGGPKLRTGYLGSVSGSAIAVFDSPVAGAPPVHWDW